MPKLRIEPGACLLPVLGIVFLPARWLLGVILAASVHELSHAAAAVALGCGVREVTLGFRGARMVLGPATRSQEVLCAAAGPVGSLLLLSLIRRFPEAALAGFVQGCFNLLPIYGLDGGRILGGLVGERVYGIIQNGFPVAVAGGLIWGICTGKGGWMLFPLGLVLLNSIQERKSSCKESNPAVQ